MLSVSRAFGIEVRVIGLSPKRSLTNDYKKNQTDGSNQRKTGTNKLKNQKAFSLVH